MVEADIEAVDQERDVELVFVLAVRQRGELIRRGGQQGAKLAGRHFPPVVDVVQRTLVADPVGQSSDIAIGAGSALVPVVDHPVFGHGG
jgi:hypothetical protein